MQSDPITPAPALQPQPDAPQQAVAYLAFPEDDLHLARCIGLARQATGTEGVAFAYAHGQPGVKPVLVVLSTQEPHVPGITFRRA